MVAKNILGGVIGIAPNEGVTSIIDIPFPKAWSVVTVTKHAPSIWTVKWTKDGIPGVEYEN